ncbi:MAG: hypothetical protein E7G42_01265 [Serratia marcescens]|nr:hypothetical protein [Serratia marcescens]MDU3817767.1 hypothetical protein [Pantoea sp.]
MQPEKMSAEELSKIKVKSGHPAYLTAGKAWFAVCILGAVVLNFKIENFFEHYITLFIAVSLLGLIGYFKYNFPRIGLFQIGIFIISLVIIEAVGHAIEVSTGFSPALLFGHIAVELLSIPFFFKIFARWYLKKEAEANAQEHTELRKDEDIAPTKHD